MAVAGSKDSSNFWGREQWLRFDCDGSDFLGLCGRLPPCSAMKPGVAASLAGGACV